MDLYPIAQGVVASRPASIKHSQANCLPSDILYIVLEEYVLEETPGYPVETLLLVCKSWMQAALNLPRLWSTFKMRVNDFKFWRNCISRRLGRCPNNTLVDIHITLSGPRWPGMTKEDISNLYNDILALLAGPKGEVARRWRSFTAWDPYDEYGFEDRSRFFIFPTPFLQTFKVHGFSTFPPFLPEVPSLRVFYAIYGNFACLPNLSATVDVTLDPRSNPQSALMKASLLVSLKIQESNSLLPTYDAQYRLSSSHPHLESLHLTMGLLENGLEGFSVPALKRLSVAFRSGAEFRPILSCRGFPLENLREVTIRLYDPPRQHASVYLDGLRQFLYAIKNAVILELWDWYDITMVLKLLEDESQNLFQDHSVTLKIRENEIELSPGCDRVVVINNLRHTTGAIYGTWDEIFAKMNG
ncbi:hypothetical protein M408DRAFT_331858 [Serendipita vermifera MAFF 305830]|uniref:F-box domain-containing protein n=1 Tax=Serendipita vermifera MAFF 305830 TaxID=933852 RepID=A0A0C3AI70_SERVB|nr:hypothetical protein M408DRAFT_331858 [Serendipita vermifera MAFF 305830]